ncbi:MAG: carboxymuconolactone decarboxylase family protein [Gammaproteobacteria bacterium]|nr:carboxymuconolactone decarboxylase family protein [Gammaproteobacteria bacterium]
MTNALNRFALITALTTMPLLAWAQSGEGGALPPDIDPESLSRLPALERSDLDAEGQRVYDLVVGDGPPPRTGPAAVSLYSPKVAEGFHILNDYLRRHGELEPRDFEVAILIAAWEFEQAYEWSAHEAAARRVGVPDAVIDTIKHDREIENLSPKDSLIIRFGRQLFRQHELDSATFAEAVEHFGERGTVELAAIMGDYVMAGLVLTAVDQHLPEDRPNTLPAR